jgi:hypothetical protein
MAAGSYGMKEAEKEMPKTIQRWKNKDDGLEEGKGGE